MDSQSFLQHSYFVAAAAIVLVLVVLRIFILRRRNRALSDFFRIPGSQYPYVSHAQNDTSHGLMRHGVQLAPLPAAYRPDRRIHAADTDAYGRRLDSAGGDGDGKDALPAYDNFDRPPKYIEAGWSHGQPASHSVAVQSAEEAPSGSSSRALENPTDHPYDDTPGMTGVHVTEPIPPPPTYHVPVS